MQQQKQFQRTNPNMSRRPVEDAIRSSSIPIDSEMPMSRTPIPTDREQAFVLIKRNWRNDRKRRPLLFARLFMGPLMWMLYTIGYFLNSGGEPQDYQEVNGFRLYPGEKLAPASEVIYLAGKNDTLLGAVEQDLMRNGQQVTTVTDVNVTSFQSFCGSEIGDVAPNSKTCVFLESDLQYTLLFGGGETVLPFDGALSGTQSAIQGSILRANGFGTLMDTLYPVNSIQKVPEKPHSRNGVTEFFLLLPGVMLALASSFALQFMIAPLSTEKFKEIARSFLLVGVKHRVYLHQWFIYLSAGGILTAAALTGISIGWNMFAESSAGLLFLSHFLAMTHLSSMAVLVSQVIWQEELAQGLPFLSSIVSMAVAVPLVVFVSPQNAGLAILTVFSPFVGIIQYCAIYGNYDAVGFGTGIHAGDNVHESGLLGNIIGQLIGNLFFHCIILFLARTKRPKMDESVHVEEQDELLGDNFEPLPQAAEVLLTARDLEYTFQPGCCQRTKPVEVLKGLDLNLCRGEVFSYLGVNGKFCR